MDQFNITLANHTFSISVNYPTTREYCREYFTEEPGEFSIVISKEDIALEREKCVQEDQVEGISHREFSVDYLETIAVQRKAVQALLERDVLLFHGSAIAVDGEGYLFTAKSGIGKSTHTRLWRELLGERVVMVNDDKPFLRFENGKVYVHGSPWSGKHRLGSNCCVPLRAICILERGRENCIYSISAGEALLMLLQQSSRPADPTKMTKYMYLISLLAEGINYYCMQCNMDPEAAQTAWKAMGRKVT